MKGLTRKNDLWAHRTRSRGMLSPLGLLPGPPLPTVLAPKPPGAETGWVQSPLFMPRLPPAREPLAAGRSSPLPPPPSPHTLLSASSTGTSHPTFLQQFSRMLFAEEQGAVLCLLCSLEEPALLPVAVASATAETSPQWASLAQALSCGHLTIPKSQLHSSMLKTIHHLATPHWLLHPTKLCSSLLPNC